MNAYWWTFAVVGLVEVGLLAATYASYMSRMVGEGGPGQYGLLESLCILSQLWGIAVAGGFYFLNFPELLIWVLIGGVNFMVYAGVALYLCKRIRGD